MKHNGFRPMTIALTVVLACGLWFVTFYLSWLTFWIKIAFSAAILAVISLWLQPSRIDQFHFDKSAIFIGLVSAGLLYFIFFVGKLMSSALLPFAQGQIGAIYGKGAGTSPVIIMILLFFVTGPCEEIYWRGYLQRNLTARYGNWLGWALATIIYAGVHIWSFNFMLIGAAAVAGAFWGAMYWRLRKLAPIIISHSVWSTVIFAVFPMP
ncbi:MAG: type II CAAX endopeptidase family protein [Desulfobacterales bacterium]|nr:type II CAAX endopeptidase family protein [Desulfobacterales bacterium]